MFVIYIIIVLTLLLCTWAIYAAISERTTGAASDLAEAADIFHGTFSNNSSLVSGKNMLFKCTHKEREFSISVISRHSPSGNGADFDITVHIKNTQIQVLIVPRTFTVMLDKLSSNCRFSKAAEMDLRGRTAYVVGKNQDDFIHQIRGNPRLAEAVRYLTFESGLDGFGLKNGTLRSIRSFKARFTQQENLRAMFQEFSIIADALDSITGAS